MSENPNTINVSPSSILFKKQLELNESMINTASEIKSLHYATVFNIKKTHIILDGLNTVAYHLQNIIDYNESVSDTLFEQNLYLKNLLYNSHGFNFCSISPSPSFPDTDNDLYADNLYADNDLLQTILDEEQIDNMSQPAKRQKS
jgi:hypothetical protein